MLASGSPRGGASSSSSGGGDSSGMERHAEAAAVSTGSGRRAPGRRCAGPTACNRHRHSLRYARAAAGLLLLTCVMALAYNVSHCEPGGWASSLAAFGGCLCYGTLLCLTIPKPCHP